MDDITIPEDDGKLETVSLSSNGTYHSTVSHQSHIISIYIHHIYSGV